MKNVYLLALATAITPLVACSSGDEPTPEQIVRTLERTEESYLGLGRLEFAAALERRLDEVHRLREDLSEAGVIDEATGEALEDRHAAMIDGLVELKLEGATDWEERRNELVSQARELEDEVVERVTNADS